MNDISFVLFLFSYIDILGSGVPFRRPEFLKHILRLLGRSVNAYIFGFDLTNESSFSLCIANIRLQEEQVPPMDLPSFVRIVVGNKVDLVDERKVSKEQVRSEIDKIDASIPYFEWRARTVGKCVRKNRRIG